MEQGTAQWLAARAGRITASRISDVMAQGRGGKPSATRENYIAQLIAERLTGTSADSFTSAAMEWGTEQEPAARSVYEFETGNTVQQVGFVLHPILWAAGASPDGLIGDKGLVEIKCPNTATHLATLTGGKIDRKYLLQMQWQMECTNSEWCDFVSYDPRVGPDFQIHVQRVNRDDDQIKAITSEVRTMALDVSRRLTDLCATRNVPVPKLSDLEEQVIAA